MSKKGRPPAQTFKWLTCALVLLLCGACKDPPAYGEQTTTGTDPVRLEQLKKQAQAAQAAAATQAKLSAEKALQRKQAAELKSAQDKMFACCEAIAKQGFEGRSMDHMNAFELCDAAHKKAQDFASIAEAVRGALHGGALPAECAE
jgi:hypothetical protein